MNELSQAPAPAVRHILSLSGGKDSTALAIYMRDKVPEMEYAFCDTGEELKETYEYLDKLEVFLGKSIVRLNPDRPFTHYLQLYGGVLPDARTRWCTRMLKIKPFERYVGNDSVINYIGIRADENRKGNISHKSNLKPRYPFIEDGINKDDVKKILEESGVGLPDYYKWRSRSGCYFCFFQQRVEWAGLLQEHPELFDKAKDFEKHNLETGKSYTWNQRESLEELAQPERLNKIREDHKRKVASISKSRINLPLAEVLEEDEEGDEGSCMICQL